MEIIAPVVNLNGTSKDSLAKEFMAAYLAVGNAINVLSKVTVHGRDFQTARPGEYEVARTQHLIRLKALEQVKEELEVICLKINAQDA